VSTMGNEVQISRLPTGIPALDSILSGGIPTFSACVIAGLPGAGKTVLTQEILFRNAKPNAKSLYLTTVSEPAAKVVRYQQQFSFFDAEKVGEDFLYMDLGEIIRDQGPEKSLDVLTKLMKDYMPGQIAIDSFRALHDLIPQKDRFRTFVFELAVKLGSWSTTAFLVGEYTAEEISTAPEFAIADSIINLTVEPGAGASRRYLEVLKLRGSNYLSGKHLYRITSDGLQVFPRVFASLEEGIRLGKTRVTTGVSQLDLLLQGGVPERAVIAVMGSAGTGKTLLGMQFVCQGAQEYGEPGVYYSFEESEEQLFAFAESFGWNVRDLIDRNLLRIYYQEPIDLSPEEQMLKIRDVIGGIGAKRVVLDSLSPLLSTVGEDHNIRQIFYQMTVLLKEAGATGIIVSDIPMGSDRISRFGPEESVFDGIIALKNLLRDGLRERFVEVYKMRGTRHVTGDQRFRITDKGIVIFPKPGEGEQYD
jgi:circadian clock protein KaiC